MARNSQNFVIKQHAALSGAKGHMSHKSSPFAPTQSKLTSQYMIVDQMNSHYRKILSAKSSIDMSVPKSCTVSQKARDTAKRKTVGQNKPPQIVRSKSEMQNMSFDLSTDDFDDGMSMHDMELIKTLVNETMTERNNNEVKPSMMNGKSRVTADRVQHQLTQENMQVVDRIVNDNRNSPRMHGPSHDAQSNARSWARSGSHGGRPPGTPRKVGGDLLDTRKHKFVDTMKPFTPRTLRSDRKSALSQYKYYRPANKKKTLVAPSRSDTPGGTENMEGSSMLDDTLMSRDFSRLKSSGTVPPLDISLDKDHMKWLKEQSAAAQLRMQQTQREYTTDPSLNQNDVNRQREPPVKATRNVQRNHFTVSKQNNIRGVDRHDSRGSSLNRTNSNQTFSRAFTSSTMLQVHDEEEELKYLNFITDVTNDVLTRGIFTNRVLKQVFEQHIHKRQGELKISRMRALLDTLREDLGIATDDNDTGIGMGNTVTLDDLDLPKPSTQYQKQSNSDVKPKFAQFNGSDNLSSKVILDTIDSDEEEAESDIESEVSIALRSTNNVEDQVRPVTTVTSKTIIDSLSDMQIEDDYLKSMSHNNKTAVDFELDSKERSHDIPVASKREKEKPSPQPRIQRRSTIDSSVDIYESKTDNISVSTTPFKFGNTIKPAKRASLSKTASLDNPHEAITTSIITPVPNVSMTKDEEANGDADNDAVAEPVDSDDTDEAYSEDDFSEEDDDDGKTLNRTYSKDDF